ncbi:hypothetical protein B566_EDAN001043 [Ephemera danica]|nr:hypothetical protein B566_EDAN001043 [Ephemera danica]
MSKVTQLFTMGVYGGLAYYTYTVFNFKIGSTGLPEMKLSITEAQLNETLKWLVPGSMFMGLSSLCLVVSKDLGKALLDSSSVARKIPAVLKISVCTAAILFMTAISMVPYSSIRPPSNTESQLLTAVRPFYARTQRLHLTSSYGLFRRMTGVGGRPEVIIEGANALEGPWLEYNFRYKPGNLNSSLPIVAPHQPRLDWQMWFAALSTYHTNPWIVSLAYRLLQGQPEVLRLLDEAHNPFPLNPPKSSKVWWQREKKGEYFPIYTKDHKPLLDYLRQHKFIDGRDWPIRTMWLKELLDAFRRFAAGVEPSILVVSFFLSASLIVLTQR